MNQIRIGRLIMMAVMMGLVTGCTQKEYAPVTGVVTFDGKPVANANIAFDPDNDGPMSVGTTTPEGAFSLSVARERDKPGAKVGSHRVTITAFEEPSSSQNSDPALGSLAMATESEAGVTNLLPDRYADFGTSGLTFDVSASGENFAEFKLVE